MVDDATPPDRRQHRRRSVRAAAILTGVSAKEIPCVILDISKTGAKLHVHDASEVPERFWLRIIADDSRHVCEVVRRVAKEIGVKFAAS